MQSYLQAVTSMWTWWQKVLFRFFFIYLLLQMLPWWASLLPGSYYIMRYYYDALEGLVQFANARWFHIANVLVYPNGSSDTSYGWAEQWTYVLLALAGCIIWSVADQRRAGYQRLNYWLCLVTRYLVALVCFQYGFSKLVLSQMPYPTLSQMATPLGDFLPMRFSWMFIGYSRHYQFFSGLMEFVAGLLLLYRGTITLGVLMATGVFINVMMLNLSYDIPVKLLAMNMVLMCLFLVANEYKRILCFFVLNRPASTCNLYHFDYRGRRAHITRWVLKIAFVAAVVVMFNDILDMKKSVEQEVSSPIKAGMYQVAVFAINKDTLPALITDTLRWQDIIFEKDGSGSVNTTDTALFRPRYRRGYFNFTADTLRHILALKKYNTDSLPALTLYYQIPDSTVVHLWGKHQNDSLYVKLVKSNRHFQLTTQPFHWLSEGNR